MSLRKFLASLQAQGTHAAALLAFVMSEALGSRPAPGTPCGKRSVGDTSSSQHAGHAVRRNRTRSAAGKLDFVEGDYSARRASDDVAVSAQDQVGRGRVAGEAQVLGNGGARVEVPFRATLARLGVVVVVGL